jgi:ribonuclease-3
MTDTVDNELEKLLNRSEEILEFEFEDRALLRQALTHASLASRRIDSNERLEFLGDAILGSVVSEELFHRYPDLPEGDLTRMKSVLVSRDTCARITQRIKLDEVVRLGKGVRLQQQIPASILAALYEAVIGAVYIEAGYESASELILRTIDPEFDCVETDITQNFKSTLQQLGQKEYGATPSYRVVDEQGPDHSKCFKIAAFVSGREFTGAWGNSKKQAEQRAAENALCEMAGDEPPHVTD